MNEQTVLYGGKTVLVKLRDGQSASIHIRLINIDEIPAFLDAALDEAKALRFAVSTPDFDHNQLTDESFELLVKENTELNFTRALVMSDRRLKRAEQCGLGIAKLAQDLASVLLRYSPGSPSSADTPAANSAG